MTTETASHHEHKTLTVTLPLDRDTVNAAAQTATTVAMVPVTTAKNVLQSPNAGLPAYIGIAGLAAVGLVEWPVAAVAGVGLACLRRWGPLRPESAAAPQAKVTPAAEPAQAPAPPARHTKGG